jgi:uncharacterized protein YfcZ (UPF0381/DUF406 family)
MKKKSQILAHLESLDMVDLYRAANVQLGLNGVPVAHLAGMAGTTAPAVYSYQDQCAETLVRVLSIVAAQARAGCPLVLDRLAREAGYLLVPVPPAETMLQRSQIEAVATVVREVGETVAAFAGAVRDGVVTHEELEQFAREKREAEEALETLEALAAAMMDPREIHREAKDSGRG